MVLHHFAVLLVGCAILSFGGPSKIHNVVETAHLVGIFQNSLARLINFTGEGIANMWVGLAGWGVPMGTEEVGGR